MDLRPPIMPANSARADDSACFRKRGDGGLGVKFMYLALPDGVA
jgi:hypothetical protein